MDGAQLVSLSRQIALQRQMDIVANNLANINTTGFKAENILFATARMPNARDNSFAFADQPLAFTDGWSTRHDLAAGPITDTGDPLDVALSGNGFLVVQTPNGERYTRDGAFSLDSTGTLVDLEGNAVLGEGGPIRLTPNDTNVSITANGSVLTPNGAKGKLRIVEFDDPQQLAREGNNLFSGGTPVPATATTIVQGSIEHSNVSGVGEMTEMIRVSRAYETLANIMEQQDETARSAIGRLGSLSA